MHPALLNAYAVMLPRLRAAETVRMVNAVAMGTGSMKEEDRRKMSRMLDIQQQYGAPIKKRSLRQQKALLGMAGIKVIEVPPREKGQ